MYIKICGIQSVTDAQMVIKSGADYIGLNFVRSSKRRVTMDVARQITQFIHSTPSDIKTVGVFQNQTSDYVNMVADNMNLDFVQLHGNETPEYCTRIERPIIKAFSLESGFDVEETSRHMNKYHVAHYLVDRTLQGEGDILSIDRLGELANCTSFFLAGGLTPNTIRSVVTAVRPFGIDVAGGVETDGVIDEGKVKKFVSQI
ncbi:MAG: phosphoribosylanthranilate isomerase [Candidatus Roizmanbacteria bacterium]|nr:phosphoribosylanthranilate isomerase [Candidatus Roizmanbacteria bacterium]